MQRLGGFVFGIYEGVGLAGVDRGWNFSLRAQNPRSKSSFLHGLVSVEYFVTEVKMRGCIPVIQMNAAQFFDFFQPVTQGVAVNMEYFRTFVLITGMLKINLQCMKIVCFVLLVIAAQLIKKGVYQKRGIGTERKQNVIGIVIEFVDRNSFID